MYKVRSKHASMDLKRNMNLSMKHPKIASHTKDLGNKHIKSK